ncbi:MAG: malto-oligosyltrehalose synthase [Erythrobacter sp.]
MTPRATYRLQFHPGFTLDDARSIVPYLADLGVSHVYASPLAEARTGSTHGYDVTDPARIRAALGGEAALYALSADLRERGMGLILDIVPNHMAAHPENPWWRHVLEHGRDSEFAPFFDIDWTRHDGRLLLPVLGTPLSEALDAGDIEIVEGTSGPALRLYGEQDYPIAPGSVVGGDLRTTIEQQHYRLAWWQLGHDELNWRRFFSISELAGLRIEDNAVFEAVHALPLRLYREGVIDGLRIDHVDGLADPYAYLAKLRERLDAIGEERGADDDDAPAWLIVEKILGPGETLPVDWPVDGTSGYDFMDEVSLLLHAPDAKRPLTRHWQRISKGSADFESEERAARRQLLHWEFSAQFEQCVDALVDLAQRSPETSRHSRAAWARAVEALLIAFPVYRTYGTGNAAPEGDRPAREEAERRLPKLAPPGEVELGETILGWLAGNGPVGDEAATFVQRFQQLSAPIAAKAVEDTAFYRFGRWISRNDVGFDPGHFSASISDFHVWQSERAAHWPRTMLATATHDHKRGEDVRARLFAISEVAEDWIAASERWTNALPGADGIHRGDLYMLLQAIVGAWPDDTNDLSTYADRLRDYAVKTVREAKLRSSWTAPQTDYEDAVGAVIDRLVTSDEGAETRAGIVKFLETIGAQERTKSLAQTFLGLTCPGVPDIYQGTEYADRSLVDPDNRRPVDFAVRERSLREGSDEKQAMIHALLSLRIRFPKAFEGEYAPLDLGEDMIGFRRGDVPDALFMVAALREGSDRPRDRLEQVVPQVGSSLLAPDLPCGVFTVVS